MKLICVRPQGGIGIELHRDLLSWEILLLLSSERSILWCWPSNVWAGCQMSGFCTVPVSSVYSMSTCQPCKPILPTAHFQIKTIAMSYFCLIRYGYPANKQKHTTFSQEKIAKSLDGVYSSSLFVT